jgi:hypothetical protein
MKAVEVLSADYKTTPDAIAAIDKGIRDYYTKDHAAVYASKRADIDRAIAATKDIFQKTRFPEMGVDWRTHPDNIGHFYFQGCFRCHDNQHVNKDGKAITKDCHACHDVLSEEVSGAPMFSMPKNDFAHPVDLGDMTAMTCSDCHTGKPMS